MKFGIFYEHQLPRPWEEGSELKLIQDALEQVELADKLGFDVVWEVEHHFLEEYSHSSAPEVFLAACSQRTKRHPARPRHHPDRPGLQPPGPHRRAGGDARPRVGRPGRVRVRRVVVGGGAGRVRHRPVHQARGVARGPRGGDPLHDRDAVHGRRRAVRADAAAQRRARSRCRSRTRRCGWPARGATRSSSPPRRASARWPSRSSTRRRPSTGSPDYEATLAERCVPVGRGRQRQHRLRHAR